GERFANLRRGRLTESLQRDVADLAVKHDRERHGRNTNDLTRELHVERLGHAGPEKLRGDLCARWALEHSRDLVRLPVPNVHGVDTDDLVAHANTGTLGWCMWEDLRNRNQPVLTFDRHPDAGVEAGGILIEQLEVFG